MKIYVRTLTCFTIALDMKPSDTIEMIKMKVMERQGYPVDQQRLIFAAK